MALLAVVVLVVVVALIHALPIGSTEVTSVVDRAMARVPRWLTVGAAAVAGSGSTVLLAVALTSLIRSQQGNAINALVAAITAMAAATGVFAVMHTARGPVADVVVHGRGPDAIVADTGFIAFLVASDLMHRSRWARWCTYSVVLLLVTGLALNAVTPFGLIMIGFGGLAFGWSLRWAIGVASLRPGMEDLKSWLRDRHGVELSVIDESPRHTSAHLAGLLSDGRSIEIWMSSRDTRGVGLIRRLWTRLRLSPPVAGHAALGYRSQLQQLALASYRANGAGVLSPAVMVMAELPIETLVLVMSRPEGRRLEASVDDRTAELVFRALRQLHDAGVAHRDLRKENIVVTKDRGGFLTLDSAFAAAGELVLRLDVVQLLTTIASCAGADCAIRAFRAAYRPVDEEAIASVLQPIALAPWGWAAMREARGRVGELRRAFIGSGSISGVTRLERFRWRTVVSAIAVTVTAYLLVGQISKVNLLGALGAMNIGWFAVAVVGSSLTYLAAAENLAAFVPEKLSPTRGFFVQLSSAFVGVAMPPTVGHIAVNARYLSRQQIDEGSIAAAIALSQVVNIATTTVLLFTIGLLTGSGISRFHVVPGGDVIIGLLIVAGMAGILLLIPSTRATFNRSVWPHIRNVWPRLLDALSRPSRLVKGVLTNLALTFGYLMAFIASLWALGARPAILPAVVVYLAGNTVGSIAPTPGGLGAVETVLVAGLSAIGIPAHEAIPAVLVFRVATFWLPIPAGWIAFIRLQRRGVL